MIKEFLWLFWTFLGLSVIRYDCNATLSLSVFLNPRTHFIYFAGFKVHSHGAAAAAIFFVFIALLLKVFTLCGCGNGTVMQC